MAHTENDETEKSKFYDIYTTTFNVNCERKFWESDLRENCQIFINKFKKKNKPIFITLNLLDMNNCRYTSKYPVPQISLENELNEIVMKNFDKHEELMLLEEYKFRLDLQVLIAKEDGFCIFQMKKNKITK